jgi:multimeric flavodoxin WrbA
MQYNGVFCNIGVDILKILVLLGSPRKNGNTATLLKPFLSELENKGAEVKTILLHDKKIAPCLECYQCQNKLGEYGCSIKDDMYGIADDILKADCFILASPIFIWFCTAPMKAMLDRFYGLHKYYGEQRGPSLLEGKKCGIIATCGYDLEYGISPFEDGIKRFCKHFKIEYIGKAAVRDEAGDSIDKFESEDSKKIAVDFAEKVISCCKK